MTKRKPIEKTVIEKRTNISESQSSVSIIDIDLTEDHVDRKIIEKIAGFPVKNVALYQRALVHLSIETLVNKSDKTFIRPYLLKSNEKLEFLGDNILKAIMAEYLFKRFPNKAQGFMTKVKTRMENTSMFCHFAESCGIKGNILFSGQAISVGVLNEGTPQYEGVLEDAFEAFVGAIFLDQGFEKARSFALTIFDKYMDDEKILKDTNYKDKLVRYCNNVKIKAPEFVVRETFGEAHSRTFVVDVYMFINGNKNLNIIGTNEDGTINVDDIIKFGGELYGSGTEKTKKAAEQAASKQALKRLKLL